MRGIAAGDMFRRLVSRSLAACHVDAGFRLSHQAIPVRTSHLCRSGCADGPTPRNPRERCPGHCRVAGRSAYDCISRAAFLSKLREVAPELAPFARPLLWTDFGVPVVG